MPRKYHRTTYKRRFPIFGFLVLIFAGLWLLREIGVVNLRLPFLPVLLIVIAVGIIFNRMG